MSVLIVDKAKSSGDTKTLIWYTANIQDGGLMIVDLALGFEEFPVSFLSRFYDLIELCSDDSVLIHLEYDYDGGSAGFASAYPSTRSSLAYDSHTIEVPTVALPEDWGGGEHERAALEERVEKFTDIAIEYASDWLLLNKWSVDKIGEWQLAQYEAELREASIDDFKLDDCDIDEM